MARLNLEIQKEEEPKRMNYAKQQITKLGYIISHETDKEIKFTYKGETVTLFPYSGWHTGKSIKDGRGISNLLNQISK